MKKLTISFLLSLLSIMLTIYSCNNSTEEGVKTELNYYNDCINDTIVLNDGHTYYLKSMYSRQALPIHSQYCKKH